VPEAEIRQGLAGAEIERYADDDTAPRYGDPDRLARIAAMGVVDDLPPDEALQRLVAETAAQFRVPIAVVSIVLGDRQWFKAHHGLGGAFLADRGSPIDGAFCRHVVDACAPLVVPDASAHPVFATNPSFVRHGVRGYAGAPLVTPDGDVLGTLCIIDSKPLAIVYDDRGPGPAPPS
jgi:GAF domain-containing protein